MHVKIVLNCTNAGLHQRSVLLVLVMCLGEKQNELTGHKVNEIANKQRLFYHRSIMHLVTDHCVSIIMVFGNLSLTNSALSSREG